MPQSLSVHLLPRLVDPAELTASCAVVIDVLRASTTIVQALSAGAQDILTCHDAELARRQAASIPQALLAGERSGVALPGFDLGNSPSEYQENVRQRTIVFTTTNGTASLHRARQARVVVVAAFTNLSAVCTFLAEQRRVDVICSGTDGVVTAEDALLAGVIVDRLCGNSGPFVLANDSARICQLAWRALGEPKYDALVQQLELSAGGRNLIAKGFAADIEFAAQVDLCAIVPRRVGDRLVA